VSEVVRLKTALGLDHYIAILQNETIDGMPAGQNGRQPNKNGRQSRGTKRRDNGKARDHYTEQPRKDG
jgi:hypothetical protein